MMPVFPGIPLLLPTYSIQEPVWDGCGEKNQSRGKLSPNEAVGPELANGKPGHGASFLIFGAFLRKRKIITTKETFSLCVVV